VSDYCLRGPNTACLSCGKAMYRRPADLKRSNGRAFCCLACYGISCRKENPCIICGKLILGGLHKKTCSRTCSNKNRSGTQYKLGRPRDKARVLSKVKERLSSLRGRKCERCTYNIFEVLQVHHKNRDRKDNRPENLELICPNCHFEEHYLK
jgi:hypothetical protein